MMRATPSQAGQRQQKLPSKNLEAVATVTSPSLADVAFLGDYTVEQNEAHYATDVKKQEKQRNSCENQRGDQFCVPPRRVCQRERQCGVDNMPRRLGVLRRGPIEIASSAGTYFSGEKSDQRQASPLAKAEGFQELLLGVMEGRIYGVNGRDRQRHPWLPITAE